VAPVKKTAPVAKKTAPAKKAGPAKAVAPTKKAGPAKAAKKVAVVAPEVAPPPKATLKPAPPRKAGTVICPISGFEVKPEKPNLTPKQLDALRERLYEERRQHVRQADELKAEADALNDEREQGDTQFDEESGEGDTLSVERERGLFLSATARQAVGQIDAALARMDAGNYGLCTPSGRRISLPRLEAIPWAELCVDCKARAERRR
jgi:RNA polymerase-binding protein DksA